MKKAELMNYINSTAGECLTHCKSDNPLIAWSIFMDKLDSKVRRIIGNSLESQGKNRYTGAKR
jgi:hypothetical protein